MRLLIGLLFLTSFGVISLGKSLRQPSSPDAASENQDSDLALLETERVGQRRWFSKESLKSAAKSAAKSASKVADKVAPGAGEVMRNGLSGAAGLLKDHVMKYKMGLDMKLQFTDTRRCILCEYFIEMVDIRLRCVFLPVPSAESFSLCVEQSVGLCDGASAGVIHTLNGQAWRKWAR